MLFGYYKESNVFAKFLLGTIIQDGGKKKEGNNRFKQLFFEEFILVYGF